MKIKPIIFLTGIFIFFLSPTLAFQDPDLRSLIDNINQAQVGQILKKLESFKTRHVFSSDREGFGIYAAAEWIYNSFQDLNQELKVSFDTYDLKAQGGRMNKETTIRNVVAVLPGRQQGSNERIFIVNAHYDTIARNEDGSFSRDYFDNYAPGVNDDGTGIAALLEIARVFISTNFNATLYFVAFSGEEIGLVGSILMAERLKKQGKNIVGVIGLDMLGNIEGGNGMIDNHRIRVFSGGPMDSSSRQMARYVKKTGEFYFPSAHIQLIFREDRFGRGGDHTSFVLEGWPGIRIMEANENYSRQHTIHDTLENLSLDYCTRNIKIVAAVLASLASAPPQPEVNNKNGRPLLGRGESGYDAHLRWLPVTSQDLSGYKIFWRSTSAPFWEKELYVGNTTEFVIKNMSIDEYVFGVSAVDQKGHESLISAYVMPKRTKRSYETKENLP